MIEAPRKEELQAAHQTDEQSGYRGYDSDHYVYYGQKGDGKSLRRAFEAASLEDSIRAAALPKAGPMQELAEALIPDPEEFPS
ncbi:uncharacterized protein BO87DRAFT_422506 [Aspergillus neoniger CBS 115656]|uniref:Uncharacterized protein n=1 Tax=Aspergillus neoniger (strain CBS 115656) TaxID=1448310 RepID=A0A318Z1A0_ASPNB|nr:hypothetical protein BO87DRAFT_422506 [Aspergillus neoniger CBS 115656]PYH37630.1 hypothetical protein BO87DRAFT_422506 [Aspergillus neoniger CBS 115656]